MNHIAYFICAGIVKGEKAEQVHVDMCNLAIKSLRNYGEYDGDIMVITDRPDDFSFAEYTIELSEDRVTSINDIGRLKFVARKWIDISMFDSILYLDNDILIMNDIQPILNLPDNTIAISEEYPLNMMNTNIPFMSDEEKQQSEGMIRINTGCFCIDSDIFLDVTEKIFNFLNKCLDKYEYNGVEQKPVNVMVIREELPYDPIPHGWVEFPLASQSVGPQPIFSSETKVLHFAGNANYAENQLKAMKKTLPLIEEKNYKQMMKEFKP